MPHLTDQVGVFLRLGGWLPAVEAVDPVVAFCHGVDHGRAQAIGIPPHLGGMDTVRDPESKVNWIAKETWDFFMRF